jgi:Icc-related predicted phosphoesterase
MPQMARSWLSNCTYLIDDMVTVEGLNIYGSPWQPTFFDWAFNLDRGAPLKEKWDLIPSTGVDILVTHGPPMGILDKVYDGERVGCEELAKAVKERIKPRLHVFGHIHEEAGRLDQDGIIYVNAATCTL